MRLLFLLLACTITVSISGGCTDKQGAARVHNDLRTPMEKLNGPPVSGDNQVRSLNPHMTSSPAIKPSRNREATRSLAPIDDTGDVSQQPGYRVANPAPRR
jgi:hypothetical protein